MGNRNVTFDLNAIVAVKKVTSTDFIAPPLVPLRSQKVNTPSSLASLITPSSHPHHITIVIPSSHHEYHDFISF